MSTKKKAAISPLYTIKAVIILDSEGQRIAAKYATFSDLLKPKDQISFEKKLTLKAAKSPNEVMLIDDAMVLYRALGDVHVFIVGGIEENELLLLNVLNVFCDSLQIVLGEDVSKQVAMDSLDSVLLLIDELVDDGIILETDPNLIAERATMRNSAEPSIPEQTLTQAFMLAKDQLIKALR